MKIVLIPVLILFILAACDQKEHPQKEARQVDSLVAGADSMQTIRDENAPEWFGQLPVKEGFLYAAAEGRSMRANLAQSKALLKARAQLAEELKKRSVREAHETTPAGADSESVAPAGQVVSLGKTVVKQKKQIKVGRKWHVYILMEMPLQQ